MSELFWIQVSKGVKIRSDVYQSITHERRAEKIKLRRESKKRKYTQKERRELKRRRREGTRITSK